MQRGLDQARSRRKRPNKKGGRRAPPPRRPRGGALTLSQASRKKRAASSMAPPKRGPMVSSPETRQLIRSLPARAVTIVLWAPDTQGPWSAHSTTHTAAARRGGEPSEEGLKPTNHAMQRSAARRGAARRGAAQGGATHAPKMMQGVYGGCSPRALTLDEAGGVLGQPALEPEQPDGVACKQHIKKQ